MEKKEKIHITIDKDLMPRIEQECKTSKRTRSALINYILNQYFNKNE